MPTVTIRLPIIPLPESGIKFTSTVIQKIHYIVSNLQRSVVTVDTFDLVSPADHPTNNAIVDHAIGAAITVLMNMSDADPKLGAGGNILTH